MDEELVEVEDRGSVVVLSLNRPDKRNAISQALAARLRHVLAEVEDRKVLVITGHGSAFCAGLDLDERRNRPGWQDTLGVGGAQYWAETIATIRRHPAVIIAAVNGYALGGGLTLVNAAQLAIASDSAEFGAPEMGFGSFPALSGPSTMKTLLPKHAAQLIFTAERISAEDALRMGLVNEVVAPEDLLARAYALADSISRHDAAVLAMGKRTIGMLSESEWDNAIEQGILISAMVRTLADDAGSVRQVDSQPNSS